MSYFSSKKTRLYNLVEIDETTSSSSSQNPFGNRTNHLTQDFSTLDTSTVPTYEEFITKTTKTNNLNKFLLNSTHANTTLTEVLVTDDDSSSSSSQEDDDDGEYDEKVYKPKFVPKNTPVKASRINEQDENALLQKFHRLDIVKRTPTSHACVSKDL